MKFLLILGIAVLSYALESTQWLRPAIAEPADNTLTQERIALGKLLFFDQRLSQREDISCATCHNPYLAWTDGLSKAVGNAHKKGRRNTPTIVNSGYQKSFFWDARANTLEEQALGPIEAHNEMGMDLDALEQKLSAIKGYEALFEAAYPDEPIDRHTVAKALASFERSIISDNAPFDRWIRGDAQAISDDAQQGFELFIGKGRCTSCHSGFNFSNGGFANIALGDRDLGIYELTKNRIWYGAFKTPTLREVARTAPYFHDGSVHTLGEAVHICGNGGRYRDIPRSPFFQDRMIDGEEVHLIVLFLQTLSSKNEEFDLPGEFPK